MAIAIASTCYWETDPPTYVELPEDSPWSGRLDDLRGAVFFGREPGKGEYFAARLLRDSILSHGDEPEDVYRGPSLDEAVRALNKRLDALEEDGYVKSPKNDLPTRLDATKVAESIDSARQTIQNHIEQLPPQPPPPMEMTKSPDSNLTEVQRLFTLPRGSLYLGSFKGKPALFVDETSMTDYLEPRNRDELEPGMTKVFVFDTPEERWLHVTRRGWDRLRDDYPREEMWRLYQATAHGRGSQEHFEDAYNDAKKAIQSLPCSHCGQIHWPVVATPVRGSAEWWDDPGAYFACRNCRSFLADAFAYPMIRQPTDEYPFKQSVSRKQAGKQEERSSERS